MAEPLVALYGENAIDMVLKEIQTLAKESNIPFDKKYVEVGISFLKIKANDIVAGTKRKCTLHALVSESFGEAAMYKYNVVGEANWNAEKTT